MTAAPSPSRRASGSDRPETPPVDPTAVLAHLGARTDDMVDLLVRLAVAESPSDDPAALRAPFAVLADELASLGFRLRRLRGDGTGDHLFARPRSRRRGAPSQLLVGHMDTVWPVGTLQTMPVRREDDVLYGPGVVDMKGGLVQIVFALRTLQALGVEPEVLPLVLVTADEEIGSRDSVGHLRRLAAVAERALILEPAFGLAGKLKTSRKGTGWFRVVVHGRAAHAGVSPEEGLSAILELTHQVQRLFALNDAERGITVNVGKIDGGLRANVVAPVAEAIVDVRVPSLQAAASVESAIRGLVPVMPGTEIEVEGRMSRPPMEPTRRNRELWELAERLARSLGITIEETSVGGASDGNYTSLQTATLDGLGAVGDGAHAPHEHVLVSQLPRRAALLALLVAAPALGRRADP